MSIKVGTIFTNKLYGDYEVIDYKGCYKVTIKFLNTGNTKVVQADSCRKGLSVDSELKSNLKSKRLESRVGEVYQDLEVLAYSGERSNLKCKCVCGKIIMCSEYDLLTGHDKSCGCKAYLKKDYQEYYDYPSERSSYDAMVKRCLYYNDVSRKSYWDKGITACERWLQGGIQGFKNFIEDMGVKPDESYELDRVDTDKDYAPENCRWVTKKVNMNNRGNTIQTMLLEDKVALRYILDYLSLDFCTVRDRYKSGLPFIFVFHKGSLRVNSDYKQFKKDNNISVKRLSSGLGGNIMMDTDKDKTFEKLHGEKILTYIKDEHGVDLYG